MESFEAKLAFIREMDAMKGILRANMMLDGSRQEDDAQHSWHAALMALVLREYALPQVDIDRAVQMLLVHDVVEIDAGDTYAYDEAANLDKADREQVASARIFGLLGAQGQELRTLWEEFEGGQTPTAQYANAIDRLQPLLGNFWVDGKVWKENGITMEKVLWRNEITKRALPGIWDQVLAMIEQAKQDGHLL